MPFCYSALCVGLLAALTGAVNAAQVPAGTVLDAKQEVVRHIKDEPASLDPIKAVGLPEIPVIRDLFEGLVNQDEHGNPVPGVAERWQTSDNRTFTFILRDNARWSNGDPVTAKDFVYSWRRLVTPANTSSFNWFASLAGIVNADEILAGKLPPDQLGVVAMDDHTLKVMLSRPVPYFVNLMANFSLFPVHQSTVEKYGADWTRPGNLVGNGAFKLDERVVNEKLVLTPNEHYWDHAHTVLRKVTYLPISQESNATKRYLAGDIDITESFPKNQYQKLLKTLPGEVYTPAQLGTYYYAFNTQRAPTSDPRVRKALSYAIDRQVITQKVLGTGEKPAYRLTPDVTSGFTPEQSELEQYSQAELNAQAKALVGAAGYGPGKPLKLSLLYNTQETNKQVAIAVASMWKKTLGVDVKLVNQEWKTYIDNRNSGNFDVIRASWVGDYNEPSTFLSLLTTQHSGNISRFNNAEYDRLMKDSGGQTDGQRLNHEYNQAERILMNEAPIAPIYQYTNARLIKPWVKGYPINNPEDTAYSQMLYIIKH
ncbi:peptide ABC transporter substrate-binding protein [Lonsdalea populi]|uniref:peptide ABC transporter substrate-binding protein n=1 Tax=Lonsdalea populi TaxID=1172565 RepID=UPI000DCA7523|nr:peptide ABC transporter substrate-binding protein [Lonsdalea populi]RAT71516.1 oligopeptide ABC transporter substrate-binding protein OppA [Lonsdalea populi]RAT73845.1 oligopeptide ABC transporter substrate-binding protein OppA [Lonsdalea populi]RAT77957.1 oligopeptide ABC transporter substrate-binding protein OppA [Lonsdalea populi]RAT78393.1 oligopeptide ABC transporter substrate-binding protein OppA [Lonsdalea populi]